MLLMWSWVLGQDSASGDSWLTSPVATGGIGVVFLTLLGLLVRSFLHRDDGWAALLKARADDASEARADAKACREEFAEFREQARAEVREIRAEADVALARATSAEARALLAEAKSSALTIEIAALRARVTHVEEVTDGEAPPPR